MSKGRAWINNVTDGVIGVLCLPLGFGIPFAVNDYIQARNTLSGTPAKTYEKIQERKKPQIPSGELRFYPHDVPFVPPLDGGSHEPVEKMAEFPYRNEENVIFKTAERVGVPAKYLFAIRRAENGGEDREFGIIPTERYRKDKGINNVSYDKLFRNPTYLKQASWAAHTVKNRMTEWDAMTSKQRAIYIDFVDYLGNIYCPIGADNDPNGLNAHWEPNVREFVKEYSKEDVLAVLKKQSQSPLR